MASRDVAIQTPFGNCEHRDDIMLDPDAEHHPQTPPAWQRRPAAHVTAPQEPQLAGLVCRFTSQPSPGTPLVHVPALHHALNEGRSINPASRPAPIMRDFVTNVFLSRNGPTRALYRYSNRTSSSSGGFVDSPVAPFLTNGTS